MYGSVNVSIKDLVTEKWGNETWEKIRMEAGIDDRFVKFDMYPDSITYDIVGAASKVLGVDANVVLETFGVYWVVWCMRCGYDALFRALGATLADFIANLDFLHSVYMKTLYPKMTVPSFRVEVLDNDELLLNYYSNRRGLGSIVYGCVKAVGRIIFHTEVDIELLSHDQITQCGILKDHYKYHVRFARFNLPPMGAGGHVTEEEWTSIVDGTSHLIGGSTENDDMFSEVKRERTQSMQECPSSRYEKASLDKCPYSEDEEVNIDKLHSSAGRGLPEFDKCPFSGTDIKRDADEKTIECEKGLVLARKGTGAEIPAITTTTTTTASTVISNRFMPKIPQKILLDPETFCKTFPYHLLFDSNLMIMHSGAKLQQFCPMVNKANASLRDILELDHPQIELSSENIWMFLNMIFIVTLKKEAMAPYMSVLSLRGQMIWMSEPRLFLFLCSPQLTSLNDLHEKKMHFSDIASHDLTRDLILFNQQRIAEVELAKQLEEKKEELRILMRDLELEKKKTDMLLYSMLPKEVAVELRDGKKVEAGEFEQVTISFSDIVRFTDMCSQCEPIQIVYLLNDMYVAFDELTNIHNVYKVETIGDAYMTVGGLPVPNKTHAEQIAMFGLGQLEAVTNIKSPSTGEQIRIRVGIHTGPVVAGVVGVKMPRYCLFGDTVNTASRMESHSLAGKVHISPSTYRALIGKGFQFESRGVVEIKGKGAMKTHFIIGRSNIAVDEDYDEGLIYDMSCSSFDEDKDGQNIDVHVAGEGISSSSVAVVKPHTNNAADGRDGKVQLALSPAAAAAGRKSSEPSAAKIGTATAAIPGPSAVYPYNPLPASKTENTKRPVSSKLCTLI